MTNKLSKCVIVFSATVTISLASMAFFNQMMNMPSKAMMMGSTMMQGQDKPCDCNCKKLN
jgi:hypothetical protein